MISIKQTHFYKDVLKELNYDFADIFIFDGFIISEVREGFTVNWDDHMRVMTIDVCDFIGSNGEDHIYLSNRINSYSVMPSDWLKFFRHRYSLQAYGVVCYTQGSILNAVIENLFFYKKIKRFNNLETAIQWASSKVLSQMD